MKRKIPLILGLLLILLTACNTNNLLEYKKASEKTEQITKGQTAGEFTMTTEINQEGLTAEEIKELNYVKDTTPDGEVKTTEYTIKLNGMEDYFSKSK